MAEPFLLTRPIIAVVMGVSGAGKTTLARALAQRLHWPFIEGDTLHPDANIAKMQSGVALDDTDRLPWLEAVGTRIDHWLKSRSPGIVTCSALRRRYRQQLAGDGRSLVFVYLHASPDLLFERLAARTDHFMPASLLDSQLATLEAPGDDEAVITVDAHAELCAQVEHATAMIMAMGDHA